MEFTEVQQAFIRYIKDPSQPLPQGTQRDRMQVYRELFFNNVMGFVSNGFPVLKSLYHDDAWHDLIQAFFNQHDCQSPIFIDIAKEFLDYLQTEHQLTQADPVFMLALAHYEWLELVVAVAEIAPDEVYLGQDALADLNMQVTDPVAKALNTQAPREPNQLNQAHLCLASTAKVAQYHYEVQRISIEHQPAEPLDSPVFFCIYQDEDCDVRFLQLNPLSAQVLAFLDANRDDAAQANINALVAWLVGVYPTMGELAIRQGCRQLLGQLAEKGIVKLRR